MKNMWYIYTINNYSALKNKDFLKLNKEEYTIDINIWDTWRQF